MKARMILTDPELLDDIPSVIDTFHEKVLSHLKDIDHSKYHVSLSWLESKTDQSISLIITQTLKT